MTPAATTVDALLGGRLRIEQPARGHRAGTDAVLLAAAGPRSGTVVDLGAGVGTAGLALAVLAPKPRVVLVEREPEIAGLASLNAQRNALEGRVAVVVADVTASGAERLAAGLLPGMAEAVIVNPPYFQPGRTRPSDDDYRRRAHGLDKAGDLATWMRTAASLLKARGTLTMIHRADALGQVLTALEGRFGGVEIRPVLPHTDEPASRILVRAALGSRAPLCLLPPLVLHRPEGGFTAEAESLHQGRSRLLWRGEAGAAGAAPACMVDQ